MRHLGHCHSDLEAVHAFPFWGFWAFLAIAGGKALLCNRTPLLEASRRGERMCYFTSQKLSKTSPHRFCRAKCRTCLFRACTTPWREIKGTQGARAVVARVRIQAPHAFAQKLGECKNWPGPIYKVFLTGAVVLGKWALLQATVVLSGIGLLREKIPSKMDKFVSLKSPFQTPF